MTLASSRASRFPRIRHGTESRRVRITPPMSLPKSPDLGYGTRRHAGCGLLRMKRRSRLVRRRPEFLTGVCYARKRRRSRPAAPEDGGAEQSQAAWLRSCGDALFGDVGPNGIGRFWSNSRSGAADRVVERSRGDVVPQIHFRVGLAETRAVVPDRNRVRSARARSKSRRRVRLRRRGRCPGFQSCK